MATTKNTFHVYENRKLNCILACVCLAIGIVSAIVFKGFNLGIDFEPGLGLRVQVAPSGLAVAYDGSKTARLSVVNGDLSLELRGEDGVHTTTYPASQYPTVQDLAGALNQTEGVSTTVYDGSLDTSKVLSGYGFPAVLGPEPTVVNFAKGSDITIDQVRSALSSIEGVRIQTVGAAADQVFQIRAAVPEGETQDSMTSKVNDALSAAFGANNTVVLQSDFVGPKYSSSLVSGSLAAVAVALALVLVYIWVRFRFAYALSSILALCHDVILMFSFICLMRFEVSSTTVAAALTLIGYSLNNTIVVFDRVRENVKLYPDETRSQLINQAVTQSWTRTMYSTITTLVAILPLAFLSTGDVQLFAIEMIFGLVVGTFSSNFLAPVFFVWLSNGEDKRKAKKAAATANA